MTKFFHLNNHCAQGALSIMGDNFLLPLGKNTKYLEVILDRTLTYIAHINKVA